MYIVGYLNARCAGNVVDDNIGAQITAQLQIHGAQRGIGAGANIERTDDFDIALPLPFGFSRYEGESEQ